MRIKKLIFCLFITLILNTSPLINADDHPHEHAEETHQIEADNEHDHGEEQTGQDEQPHDEEDRVHLNREQRLSAGVLVETLQPRPIPNEIEAPGEIRLNAYASSQVIPRIEAQVIQRHVRLGNQVTEGQPLVTLSSVSMSEAQATLLVAAKEWQRVKKLGKKVVSDRRFLQAQVTFQQSQAKLLAYGMTSSQTKRLIDEGNISRADGQFTLLAPQAGTVIRDDFILGQMVDIGELLFELTDESTLWVEARINPQSLYQLNIDAPARVDVDNQWIDGKVIQIHHALDEKTRTLSIRLQIPNPDDRLHPGQFVTTRIEIGTPGETALTVPTEALLRSPDGDWQVFIEEETDEFEPVEVELIRQLPGIAVIEGLEPGTRIVIQGAFFIQSELAKSGFDVHNH
ncbi:MAG: efflux RND transporter periplasmic adaptor subunit [Candidatus Thiodiazotropha sp. (ex Lucinoma borealis)]|nr:efflux RND transporter periplasmic adaptor subunit [Candidatus Thiodiazotropha sp. (ex Lucinoma borealis)]